MKRQKITVADVLNQGSDNAINAKQLADYFKIDKRELLRKIQIERASGSPILAKKKEGGGYYLPADKTEYKRFIQNWNTAIQSMIDVKEALIENFTSEYGTTPYSQAIRD